jgi:hypothetical protein
MRTAPRGRRGRLLAGAGGQRAGVIHTVRESVRRLSIAHGVSHRRMNGRRHLAEERHDQYQATVNESSHGRSLYRPDLPCKLPWSESDLDDRRINPRCRRTRAAVTGYAPSTESSTGTLFRVA